MSNKTKYLKLVKPTASDAQWGTSINANMEEIDDFASRLTAKVNTVAQHFSGSTIAVFSADGAHYVKLDSANGTHITVGSLDADGEFEVVETYYEPGSAGASGNNTYNDIINSTAFYLWESYDGSASGAGSPYDFGSAPRGAILVKGEDIGEGGIIPKFTFFAQSMGTMYVPEVVLNDDTTIKFKKEFLTQTKDELEYTMFPEYYDFSHGGGSVDLGSGGTQTIDLDSGQIPHNSTNIPNIHVRFFLEENGLTKEGFVEHSFRWDTNTDRYVMQLEIGSGFSGRTLLYRYLYPAQRKGDKKITVFPTVGEMDIAQKEDGQLYMAGY